MAEPNSLAMFSPFCCVLYHGRKHLLCVYVHGIVTVSNNNNDKNNKNNINTVVYTAPADTVANYYKQSAVTKDYKNIPKKKNMTEAKMRKFCPALLHG